VDAALANRAVGVLVTPNADLDVGASRWRDSAGASDMDELAQRTRSGATICDERRPSHGDTQRRRGGRDY
jgi:hypothetical protein